MKHGKHAPKVQDMPKQGKHASVPDTPEYIDYFDDDDEVVEEKPRDLKALKIAGIVIGSLVALVLAVYLGGALLFQGRFYPNTTMGDTDISMMSASEVEAILVERSDGYALRLEGGDFSLRLAPGDVDLELDAEAAVKAMLDSRSAWEWPMGIFGAHDMTEYSLAAFDAASLKKVVASAVEEHNAQAEPPVDAAIAFDGKLGQFAIVPDKLGTAVDADALLAVAEEALASLVPLVELGDDQLLKAEVASDDERLVKATASANGMILVNVSFMLGDSLAAAVDAEVASDWISIDDEFTVMLDEDALKQWAYEKAEAMSTYQSGRTYTRADGKEVTITGGVYGWVVDAEAFHAAVKTAVETDQSGMVAIAVTQEAETYDPVTGRDWGKRYVDVDLAEQHARMYDEAGELIWESAVVSGVPGNGSGSITPTGVYQITASPRSATLKGTDWDGEKYETPVRYWMPFVGNLIGLHDADWQWAFGGNRYQIGYGSHGCVNLPVDKAYELSLIIQMGDVVVVHW